MDLELFSCDFMRRGDCGAWSPFWIVVYAASNTVTFFSYISIALGLVYAPKIERHPRVVGIETPVIVTRLRALYAAFILSCGIGHLEGLLAFSWPVYHLFAFMHAITAAVSAAAAVATWRYRIYLDRIL